MAIKRCPYCRSIIDEVDRYCNSCGTQLLFPEDENIEEDIPGERILDVEDRLPEEAEAMNSAREEPEPEELRAEDELSAPPAKTRKKDAIPEIEFPSREIDAGPDVSLDVPTKFATKDLPEMDFSFPPTPKPLKTEQEPVGRLTGKPHPSEDFESGFPASTEERDDIARLISALEKQAPPKAPPPPPPSEAEDVAFSERDLPPLRFEEETPRTPDELPPWAERVKDGVTPGFRSLAREAASREPGDLSFEAGPGIEPVSETAEADPGLEEDFRRPEEPELRPRRRRRKRGPMSRLKARLYDVLLIAVLWLAALWASSRVLSVPLFSFFQNSALQVGIFYLILLAGYFALFFSFLGETPGDRLSSPSS
ncbi:MAG: hypothetical protein A2Y86_04800 [Candidatus Aminicenantes bacterium RBG_13_62_12]|nr:MAG: hypothetical protein A2Y86_04800 [Candidatus Aminicenantes bacterium RBG_13_62_12]